MLVAALGAGVAVAATGIDQKDKQKAATTDSQKAKEKDKNWTSESRVFSGMAYGEGSYLGVFLEEVTPERVKELGLSEERGAIVMKVVEGGPAKRPP